MSLFLQIHGSRTPSIRFNKDNLLVSTSLDDDSNFETRIPMQNTLKWVSIVVQQLVTGGRFKFQVVIDGTIYSIVNNGYNNGSLWYRVVYQIEC